MVVEVYIVDRSVEYVVDEEPELLVQATALGLRDAPVRVTVALDYFREGLIVDEVVHNPPSRRC